jgi:hypothetical protein
MLQNIIVVLKKELNTAIYCNISAEGQNFEASRCQITTRST